MKKNPGMIFLALAILSLSCLSGCSLFSGTSGADRVSVPEPFFFIQMADPQFGFFSKNKEFQRETVLYEKAISEANRLKPDFVVVTGDLINLPGSREQMDEYKRISALLDPAIPLYHVAGNHDVQNTPAPPDIAWYRDELGSDQYSFQRHGVSFIVLNSCIIQHPEKASVEEEEQWIWFERELQKAQSGNPVPVIVFMHHPVCINSVDEPDGYFPLPKKARMRLLELFRKYNVRAVFSGHYHRNAFARDGDIQLVTTGPVGRPLGKDPSGFRIVEVYPDRIDHTYYGLDSLPEEISFE